MKKLIDRSLVIAHWSLFIALLLLIAVPASQAQGSGPVVDILGKPDSSTDPPNVYAYVSVVNPDTGRVVDELSADNFAVQVSEEDVETEIELDTTGVAVVMVIDRGGIARSNDSRIGDAVNLADSLLGKLDVDGSASADMVGLIGIRGREDGGLTPLVEFTDYDPNAVSNQFDALRTEIVNEVTPLYDGIDQAIEWITENPHSDIQDKLTHRRPIIVVFSDGIDNRFSSESHETIIINKCTENNILLYAVRMGGGPTDSDNLEALATQTNGLYVTHTDDTHEEVLSLFDDIVTQRQAYRLTFPLLRPKGDYQVNIQVLDTGIGDGSGKETVSSRLQMPQIRLSSDEATYTVPYSHTPRVEIQLSVELTYPDGIEREPTAVRFYRNGVLVATSTDAPFTASWDATDYITQTTEEKSEDFTFIVEADGAYLNEAMTSAPVNVHVEWEPLPPPTPSQTLVKWLLTYWWLLLILALMALGLLILLILLLRTRSELAQKVVTRTTGVLKGFTKRLGTTPQRAPGKLVVIQGANVGKEFRLSAQVIKAGRDPQFCDFALYDEYASNPHFSIQLDQTQFFITDEGSTNGTRVNGAPIPPHQRMLLQPDAIIEVGQTRLQFKRMGGTTRQLSMQPEAGPQPGAPPAPPATSPPGAAPGPVQQTHPPTQPARPPGQQVQGPAQAGPKQWSGPTERVMPPKQ